MPNPPTIRDYHFPPNGLIGEGAYGWVWVGLFKGDQPRAVKVFKPRSIQEGLWQAEYEKLRALDEPPGIVTLYDRGHTDDGGLPYVSMRLMADRLPNNTGWAGRTLSRALKADSLGEVDRWRVVREIAEILAYMHRQDVRHCDIKPGNILLSAGAEPRPVICDFGQSRTSGAEGAAMGTLLYACPEQLRDPENPEKNWDVYSFGVTAFQILTGELPRLRRHEKAEEKPPENEPTPDETLVLQRETEPLPPMQPTVDTWNPEAIIAQLQEKAEVGLPRGLSGENRDNFKVILKCLALDPSDRFADMEAVVNAFEAAARRRALAGARRKQLLFGMISLIAIGAAVFAFWLRREADFARQDVEDNLVIVDQARAKAEKALFDEAEARKQAEASNAEAVRQAGLAKAAAELAEENARTAARNAEIALLHATEATRSRQTAEGLINSMLYDLYNDLRQLGRIDLLDEVSQRAEKYFAELPEDQTDADSERERSTMLNHRGDVLLVQGKRESALAAYETSLKTREQLLKYLEAEPDSEEGRMLNRDISVSLERIGDAQFALENFAAARSAYEKSLEIRQSLIPSDKSGPAADDLAVSYAKLSDLDLAAGNFEAALSRSRAAQIVLDELAKSEPENLERQRNASAGLARLGDAELAMENADAALEKFREGVQQLRKLAEIHRNHAEIRADLAKMLVRRANLEIELGRPQESAAGFREATGIFEALTDLDRSNLAWRKALDDLGWRLAQVLDALGDSQKSSDPAAALENYKAALREFSRLHDRGDEREDWRIAQVVTLWKIARLEAETTPESAADRYRAALRLLEDIGSTQKLSENQLDWIEAIEAEMDRL